MLYFVDNNEFPTGEISAVKHFLMTSQECGLFVFSSEKEPSISVTQSNFGSAARGGLVGCVCFRSQSL